MRKLAGRPYELKRGSHRSTAEDLLDLFVTLLKDIAKEPFVVLSVSGRRPADFDLAVRRLDSRTEDGERQILDLARCRHAVRILNRKPFLETRPGATFGKGPGRARAGGADNVAAVNSKTILARFISDDAVPNLVSILPDGAGALRREVQQKLNIHWTPVSLELDNRYAVQQLQRQIRRQHPSITPAC